MNATQKQKVDERLFGLITKKRDPLSTHTLETRLRNAQLDSEREQVAMLLDIEYEQRPFIISEASFLASYGFGASDAMALAITRWQKYGWRGIHSDRARVQAARARCNQKQGLPL